MSRHFFIIANLQKEKDMEYDQYLYYRSSKGGTQRYDFGDMLITGMTPDEAILIPERNPTVTPVEIQYFRNSKIRIQVFAVFILKRFGALKNFTDFELNRISERAYQKFSVESIYDITEVFKGLNLLNLHHGATNAFKDYAQALLMELLAAILHKRHLKGIVANASSGDTAPGMQSNITDPNIYGISIYGEGQPSIGQEKQMLWFDKYSQAFAVKGKNFDYCQKKMIMPLLEDLDFCTHIEHEYGVKVVSANSINFARVIGQAIYIAPLFPFLFFTIVFSLKKHIIQP